MFSRYREVLKFVGATKPRQNHPPDESDERWTIDDADRYLTLDVRKPDGLAIFELQQAFEQDCLRLHFRCTSGAHSGQEGEIPSRSWYSMLRVSRDQNADKTRGPMDFAAGNFTARNDGRAFIELLVASDPATYELWLRALAAASPCNRAW
jgi:hypothetical protein